MATWPNNDRLALNHFGTSNTARQYQSYNELIPVNHLLECLTRSFETGSLACAIA